MVAMSVGYFVELEICKNDAVVQDQHLSEL
jgi:hypothetical protein